MRTIQSLIVTFLMLLSFAIPSRGDSVGTPPQVARQWAVATSTTAASVTFTASTGNGGATNGTAACHVRFIHGSTAASGDPDIYVSLKRTQSDIAAPTAGSEVITLKAGETLGFDGKWWQARYLAASGTPNLRIIATFNE